MIRTHYDNLQVSRNATDIVIRAAYKGLAQKYHPDKFDGAQAESERVMKILNDAYAVLSDPAQRKQHDEWIDRELAAESARSRAPNKEEGVGREFAGKDRMHATTPSVSNEVRPWVRYWARTFDVYSFCLVGGFILGIFAPQFLARQNEYALGMMLIFAWVFVEALLLSSFQTTPGKW